MSSHSAGKICALQIRYVIFARSGTKSKSKKGVKMSIKTNHHAET